MPAGTVAGIGGVLRATARRKSTRVRSRSRSPCHRAGAGAGGGEQSEQDQSTGNDACDDQSGRGHQDTCTYKHLGADEQSSLKRIRGVHCVTSISCVFRVEMLARGDG